LLLTLAKTGLSCFFCVSQDIKQTTIIRGYITKTKPSVILLIL